MTDNSWPPQLQVAFDPPALYRERVAVLRNQRIAAWGWLGLSVLASLGILLPVLRADGAGWRLLAVLWTVLLVGMVVVTVKCFAVLARCRIWADGEQPKIALRFSIDGLWVGGFAEYRWEDLRELRLRSAFGRRSLVVVPRPGVLPDSPAVAGLVELHPPDARRRRLPPRGPRLVPGTVAAPVREIADAVRHYSNGRVKVV